MSDTPRTDKIVAGWFLGALTEELAEHARTIERELAAALAAKKRAEKVLRFVGFQCVSCGAVTPNEQAAVAHDAECPKHPLRLRCEQAERERDAARAALIECADYHHGLWGDEAGASWREQQNERAAGWRKAAGMEANT